jgi:hypothetical protein
VTPDQIEALARRLAELVAPLVAAELRTAPIEDVDAKELAGQLGVSRDWVYENKVRLGGVPLGDGPKARWRFDVEKARAARAAMAKGPKGAAPRRRSQRPVSCAPKVNGRHR